MTNLLPWETDVTMPGLDDTFEYPRFMTIRRRFQTTAAGAQPEREYNDDGSVIIGLPLVPCSIQFDRDGSVPVIQMPTNVRARGAWKIFVSRSNGAAFLIDSPEVISVGDSITDDQNIRYQVTHPWWDSMGWQIKVERLK